MSKTHTGAVEGRKRAWRKFESCISHPTRMRGLK